VTTPNGPQTAWLQQYGYDAELQKRWQADVASGRLSKANNEVAGELQAPPRSEFTAIPAPGPERAELEALGRAAIRNGEVGVVVLNGGMATRFGGVVKGVVPVLGPKRSFLALVVEDLQQNERATGGRVPLFLMNSFATDASTRDHFATHGNFGAASDRIEHFTQFVALRMEKDGALFRLANGELSPYGPGHGDFPAAFRRCGALQRFRRAGGKYLLVRNVDNLGARLDPVILGRHIASRNPVTVELAPKLPNDVGGSPFVHSGRVQLVEQLRFRAGFDPNIVDVFNTNTLWFDAASLDRDFDLGWYFVQKNVEGRSAVQIEHLIGEVTAHLPTTWLRVPRDGRETRFLPVKEPDDLAAGRSAIAAMYDR